MIGVLVGTVIALVAVILLGTVIALVAVILLGAFVDVNARM